MRSQRNQKASNAVPSWAAGLLQQTVTATYWFDPGAHGEPYPATIRFRGRRTRVSGRPSPRDSFYKEEALEVIPGSGPISVTTRAYGVNPGKWIVTAEPAQHGPRLRALADASDNVPSRRPWPWVVMRATDSAPLKTAIATLTPQPGVIPGVYTILVAVGILVGIITFVSLVGGASPQPGPVLTAAMIAVVAGLIGGKGLFILQQRGRRFEGWSVQGFITALAVIGSLAIWLLGLPPAVLLNAAAPSLFLGIAIGRPGCFFAGCCGGRVTRSRLGIWSSDQRVGARRIPTQFMESVLALLIGVISLVLLANAPRLPGALLVGAIAGYVLGRQVILPMRADRRDGWSARRIATAVLASLVLASDVVLSIAASM